MKFKREIAKFPKGSLGQKYLDEIKNTKTEKAFIQGGQIAWEQYWQNSDIAKFTITELDDFRLEFFQNLLGKTLYQKISKVNDYPAEFVMHNRYIAWGRANIADLDVEKED